MADLKKVVKGLFDLRRYLEDKEWSNNRVDRQAAKAYWQTATDAITLLKEQKAVEPFHRCIGNVYVLIEDSEFNYCPYCGRNVNRE